MNNQSYPATSYTHRSQQEAMRGAYTSSGPAEQGYQSGQLVLPTPQHRPVQSSYTPVQGYQGAPQESEQTLAQRQDVGPSNGVVRSTDMGALHSETRAETYRDPMGYLVQSQQQVYEDQNQKRSNMRYRFTTGISFFFGLIEIILCLRFIFRLLGANPDAGFITLLYGLSHPFVAAFNGIFNDQTVGRAGVFEASTLVAMLIYALLAWGLIALVRALFAPVQASRQSVTTTRRSQF